LHPDSTGTTRWAASTAHAVGDRIVPSPANANGFSFRCVTAGTTGAGEPTWPTTLGTKVTDGTTAQWICDGQDVNRWHRLLSLVEVPTRSNRADTTLGPYEITAAMLDASSRGFFRTPGKINLNTLRHPDVLAGLVDEGDIYTLTYSNAYPPAPPTSPLAGLQVPLSLPDKNGDQVSVPAAAVRDWWLQFLTARDGIDPLPLASGGSGLPLAGLPPTVSGVAPPAGSAVAGGSHEFRDAGFSAFGPVDVNGYNGTLESTILRTLAGDPVTPNTGTVPAYPYSRRQLLEVGSAAGHLAEADTSVAPAVPTDYTARHRVLSKILQNTTTRSNVFLVWMQVDFFQARDINPPNGVVRIGQMLPQPGGPSTGGATTPGYRSFFVIDRSQAMNLMSQQYLPSKTSPFVFSTNPSFNWQSLVLFQQRMK
jgi:hypothetical protein